MFVAVTGRSKNSPGCLNYVGDEIVPILGHCFINRYSTIPFLANQDFMAHVTIFSWIPMITIIIQLLLFLP